MNNKKELIKQLKNIKGKHYPLPVIGVDLRIWLCSRKKFDHAGHMIVAEMC